MVIVNVLGQMVLKKKSYIKGKLLATIGRYWDNQMFPIAWAIVNVELTQSWEWFITLLKNDLNLGNGLSYTLMNDQQKVTNLTSILYIHT